MNSYLIISLSTLVCVVIATQLISDYTNDSDVTTMLDNFDFYILALMNPDGYIHTHTDVSRLSW